MSIRLRFFILLFGTLLCTSMNANHLVGANISYECLGGNTYSVFLNIFKDCSQNTGLGPTQIVRVSHDCDTIGSTIVLSLVGSQEVSQLCDDDLPQSTCNPGDPIHPGVTKEVYQGIVNIGTDLGEYRVTWFGSGFRTETVNLGDNETLTLPVYASIFKTEADECNKSAISSNLVVPYFCLNQDVSFNFGFSDPDQDSLIYSFSPAQQNGGFCTLDIPYETGYSGTEPIPGATINAQTGQINFNTSIAGSYTMVIRVDEYRDGSIIGSTFMDVNFIILVCLTPPPEGTTDGVTTFSGDAELTSPYEIEMCSGQSFCFDYTFEASTPSATLELTSNLSAQFPSATVTTSGSNPLTATVCYTAELGDNGGVLILDVSDDNCPVSGISSVALLVNVNPELNAGLDEIICFDEEIQLQVTGDTLIEWEVISGDPISVGTNFSCLDCPNPIVSPSETTTYLASGLNLFSQCIISDTVTVNVGLDAEINYQAETCDEDDGFVTIEVLLGSGDYSLSINSSPVPFDDYYEVTGIDEGSFNLSIIDNISGCSIDTLFVLEPFSIPNANAGDDVTNCGLTFSLEAIPSSGVGTWTSIDPTVTFGDVNDPNTIVTAPGLGSYELTWTEDNGPTCTSSDNVSITFIEAPVIDAGMDETICGTTYVLDATNDLDVGSWGALTGVLYSDMSDPNAEVTVPNADTYPFVWTEDNGFGCVVSDTVSITFIENPAPEAGSGVETCSLTTTINAIPSIGTGTWSGAANLTFGDVNDPSTTITSTIPGTFPATWTEDNQDCVISDDVDVSFILQPVSNAGNDTTLCGVSYDLQPIPSNGVGTWSSLDAGVIFEDVNDPFTEVTVPNFGTFTFTWTEDNSGGCIDSDDVTITFQTSPIADAGAGGTVCGTGPFQMSANLTTGVGEWIFPPEVTVSDVNDPNAIVNLTGTDYGDHILIWEESGGGCFTQDEVTVTFLEQPDAFAGLDFNVCGLATNLSAVPSVFSLEGGQWSGIGSEFIQVDIDPLSYMEVDNYDAYDLIWTEINGTCTDVDSVTVNFVSSDLTYAGADDSTCTTSYALNATPVAGGTWIAPDLIADGILDPAEVNNPNAVLNFNIGDYGIKSLTWFNTACDTGDVVLIDFLETPNTFAGLDFTNCGLEVTMSPSDNSWDNTWILPSGASSPDPNISNAIITVNNAIEYELILQQVNGICINTDTVNVNFIDIPEPDVGEDDFTCSLDYTLVVNADGINGEWSSTGVLNYMPNTTSTVTNVTAGDYGSQDIYWTETDPTGTCEGSDTLTVVFNNPPDTTNFNITCLNLNTQYQITFDLVGGEVSSYETGSNGTFIGNTFTSEVYDTFDTYSFAINDAFNCEPLIISDTFSCPSLTDAGTLNLDTLFACTNEIISAEFDSPLFLDANDVSVFVIHTSSDTLLGNILDSNYVNSEFTYNFNFNLGQLYYLSSVVGDTIIGGGIDYTDPNLDVSYGIPVIFSPPPSLLTDTNVVISCADQSTQVQFTLNGIGPWDVTYDFLNDTGSITGINNLENAIDIFESGILTFETVSNQFCTTELSDSINITIYDNPTSSMPDLFQYCTNEEYVIDIELTGQGPWDVIIQDENLLTAPLDTTVTSNSISIPVDGEGYFWVANLFDQNCPWAMNIDSTFVELLETPVSLAGEDIELCFGDSVMIGEPNEPGLTYEWSNAEWLSNAGIATPIANVLLDTVVTVEYPFILATSNTDCTVLDTTTITVRPLPFDITLDSVEVFCSGQSVPLNVVGPYDFTWTPNDGLSDPTINNPITSIEESIVYTLIAESTFGCIDSLDVPVQVLQTPAVNLSASVNGGCLPLEVEVYNETLIFQGTTCLWTFADDDSFISDSCDDLNLLFEEEGQYNIGLRIIDPNGCVNEQFIDTLISVADISSEFSYFPEEPRTDFELIQFEDLSADAVSWSWTIDELFLSSERDPSVLIADLEVGMHEVCLEVVNSEGCISILCKTLEITDEPLVWVPNAFTPDNDNLNEVFIPVISAKELVETYSFSIYNRIGRRIFETTDINEAWGRNLIAERKRSIGTYTWVVEITLKDMDEPIIYSGNVTVLK